MIYQIEQIANNRECNLPVNPWQGRGIRGNQLQQTIFMKLSLNNISTVFWNRHILVDVSVH